MATAPAAAADAAITTENAPEFQDPTIRSTASASQVDASSMIRGINADLGDAPDEASAEEDDLDGNVSDVSEGHVEMTMEQLERLMDGKLSLKSTLNDLLIEVQEWKDSVFGVYVDQGKDKSDPLHLVVVAKKDHPICQEWLRNVCAGTDGNCMYLLMKYSPELPVTFYTTDDLLSTKLTPEIRAQIVREVFLNLAGYSVNGQVKQVTAPSVASKVIKEALEMCKTWRVRRHVLQQLPATKDLMPSDEEMFEQFTRRTEGGGVAVAVPLQLWNDSAKAFLAAMMNAALDVQKAPADQ